MATKILIDILLMLMFAFHINVNMTRYGVNDRETVFPNTKKTGNLPIQGSSQGLQQGWNTPCKKL